MEKHTIKTNKHYGGLMIMFKNESKLFKKVVTVESEAKKDNDLVLEVQTNNCQTSIATLFVRYVPMMAGHYNKVQGLIDTEEYQDLCVGEFNKAVNGYTIGGKASFKTYATTAIINLTTRIIRDAKAQKRDGECSYLEDLGTYDEDGNKMEFQIEDPIDYFEQVGVVSLIDSLGLTEQQRRWVDYCMTTTSPTEAEFANLCGITRQSVRKMRDRLEKRFSGMEGVILG